MNRKDIWNRRLAVLIAAALCMPLCLGSSLGVFANPVSSNSASVNSPSRDAASSDTASADRVSGDDTAKWTVLIYMCGSDLESSYGSGSRNLEMLSDKEKSDDVNFVVETGGSRSWDYGNISADRIQRYKMDGPSFNLISSRQMSNMGDPATLTDFLKWGTKTYPAEKYMLVLWDHGGGAAGGAVVDELYDDSTMSVPEMAEALGDSGTKFDLVGFDACLMASYEVADAFSPYADYLVASEETEPDSGWDYSVLGQSLVADPEIDAEGIGKIICDSYMAGLEDLDEQYGATISLTDLSKIGNVTDAVSAMAKEMSSCISNVDKFTALSLELDSAKRYYDDTSRDLVDFAQRADVLDADVTQNVINAVREAVIYKVNAGDYMYNSGMTIFYGINLHNYYYDRYADVCPSPEYLAFLDAVNYDWRAPDWVYNKTDKVKDPVYDKFYLDYELVDSDSNVESLRLTKGINAVTNIYYQIFRIDEKEDRYYRIANMPNMTVSSDDCTFSPCFDGQVLAFDGEPCLLSLVEEQENYTLYQIPVKIEGTVMFLRLMWRPDVQEVSENEADAEGQNVSENAADTEEQAVSGDESISDNGAVSENEAVSEDESRCTGASTSLADGTFELLGIWDSNTSGSGIPSRNVYQLEDGTDITFEFTETDADGKGILYRDGGTITYDRNKTQIALQQIDDGTYAIRYMIKNALGMEDASDMINIKIRNGKIVE